LDQVNKCKRVIPASCLAAKTPLLDVPSGTRLFLRGNIAGDGLCKCGLHGLFGLYPASKTCGPFVPFALSLSKPVLSQPNGGSPSFDKLRMIGIQAQGERME
jgi:hypothetical protein